MKIDRKNYPEFVKSKLSGIEKHVFDWYIGTGFNEEYWEFFSPIRKFHGNGKPLPDGNYFIDELGDMLFYLVAGNKINIDDWLKSERTEFLNMFTDCMEWFMKHFNQEITIDDLIKANVEKLNKRHGELSANDWYQTQDKRR